MPAKEVSAKDVGVALKQLGTVYYADREVNLMAGFEAEVTEKLVNDFLRAYPNYEFVGLPHLAESRRHLALDPAHPTFWKDSTTIDWAVTPTGEGTFNEFFPETASNSIKIISNTIPHWAMLMGLLEVGTGNNLQRIDFARVNGKVRGRMTRNIQSRIGDVKFVKIGPALLLPDRGEINIDIECETAAEVEVIPLSAHIVPQEVLRSNYSTLDIVENSAQ